MKKFLTAILLSALAAGTAASGAERSFTITFGSSSTDTRSLTNDNFMTAVSGGASFISDVTSVVAVFPEKDAVRLSSSKTNGKFNIHLAENARVAASRITVNAARYDNDRDAEAALMINSETLEIPSVSPEDYTIYIPSRPLRELSDIIVDADRRVYLRSITVYYDDAGGSVDPVVETVETPVFTPAGGTVSAGTAVSIACATPGATIHYTMDGTAPTSLSPVYEGPVEVYNDLTMRAFAVREGMNSSAMAEAAFTVRNPGATLVSVFNFAEPESLNPSVAAPALKESVELDGRSFTDGDVAVSFTASESGNTHVRLYHSYDAGIDLRVYDGETVTVSSLNEAFDIESVKVTISHSGSDSDAWFIPSEGEWIWEEDRWQPDADTAVRSLDLVSYNQSRITSMTVALRRTMGIPSVDIDHDERAVYYNIGGMRVSNPGPGFYIRVTPSKAEKVVIR